MKRDGSKPVIGWRARSANRWAEAMGTALVVVAAAAVAAGGASAADRGADGRFEKRTSSHFVLYQDVDIDEVGGIRGSRRFEQQVLDELGASPEETLHVGDNLAADVAGASGLGIRSVWITRRIANPDARLQAHDGPAPDFTIRDLSELLPLIESLGAARSR